MNLLLYAEARQTLARQPEGPHNDNPLPELPDSIFEELGYFGTLGADEESETAAGDLNEIIGWFRESVLSFQT